MRMPANLKKRLVSGGVLILVMLGILVVDRYFAPNAPCLITCVIVLQIIAVFEANRLLHEPKTRPFVVIITLLTITLVAWLAESMVIAVPKTSAMTHHAWQIGFIAVIAMLSVIVEVCHYDSSGKNTLRAANTLFLLFYLGIPSAFLVMIRALPFNSTLALAATIFVPKIGDVFAYFTGSLIGKHKMTPVLSPKKTWEGFAGGVIASMLTAAAINQIGPEPLFKNGVLEAMAFGAIVGVAGVFGDLFESMLKRDAQVKDASQSIPGFGGVLDLVDSVLFAAPVAYLFFVLR